MPFIARRTFAQFGFLAIAGSLSITAVQAAPAASPITKALVANVQANLTFLDRSGALAAANSRQAGVRSYAQGEQTDAVKTAEALQSTLPVSAATEVATLEPQDTGALMTGRSVSVDVPAGGAAQAANGRAPMGDRDLAELAKLSGKKFDDAFWLKQLDALCQLRADYQAYIDDGDDAKLVELAKRELPGVERRLAALAKI